MLRNIVLHGKLATLHTEPTVSFDVDTVAEAIRACCFQIKGFEEALKEGSYHISLNENEADNDVDATIAPFQLGNRVTSIHFVPVVAGAKRGGAGKVILGVAMIALAVVTWGSSLTLMGGAVAVAGPGVSTAAGLVISSSTIASLGVSMVLGGVAQLLTPQVSSGNSTDFEAVDERASFLFNGPVNASAQGAPVPLVYGRMRVGTHVVSTGLVTEAI